MLLGVLALTFVAKAFVTLMTIRSGASGGVLQPGIALGSTLGTMLGLLWLFRLPRRFGHRVRPDRGRRRCSPHPSRLRSWPCAWSWNSTEAPIEFFVPVGMAVAASAFVSSGLLHRLG